MYVDAEDEKLADLLVDLPAAESDGAGQGDLGGERGCECDCGREKVFEEGGFYALCQGVGNGEFGHVVLLLAEGDEVVVYSGLVFSCVVEVEVFRLHVVCAEFLGFELGNLFEETLFFLKCHAPDHNGTVVEEKDFWSVDFGVEVQG